MSDTPARYSPETRSVEILNEDGEWEDVTSYQRRLIAAHGIAYWRRMGYYGAPSSSREATPAPPPVSAPPTAPSQGWTRGSSRWVR